VRHAYNTPLCHLAEPATYSYENHLKGGRVVSCEVFVFPLEVQQQKESWPEKGKRQTRWLSPLDAASVVQERVLGKIIRLLQKRTV